MSDRQNIDHIHHISLQGAAMTLAATNIDQKHSDERQIFIGRQPIFNRSLAVVGYELLFRPGNVTNAGEFDSYTATVQVINNLLMEVGLNELTGGNPAYINFTKDLILNGAVKLLPADQVVIEILEDTDIDETLVNVIRELAENNYTIALDDFTYSDKWQPLIKLGKIIKFDVMQHSLDEINAQRKHFPNTNIKLLAEKVETKEEFDEFSKAGFDFFQGYFFAKPMLISQKGLSASNTETLQLLATLQNPDVEIEEIEALISRNLTFSYKLFKYLNSAAFSLSSNVTSVKQAVVYFGLARLKKWVSLLVLSIAKNDKPAELINIALTRAKMCELLADSTNQDDKDTYFTVGLFSLLDVIFEQPFDVVLTPLPLDDSVKKAIIAHEGKLGDALNCSVACEQCKWHEITFQKLNIQSIPRIYLDSMVWSQKMLSELEKT